MAFDTPSRSRRVAAVAAALVVMALGGGLLLSSDARAEAGSGSDKQAQQERSPDHDCPKRPERPRNERVAPGVEW
jgi:hypothetical protein